MPDATSASWPRSAGGAASTSSRRRASTCRATTPTTAWSETESAQQLAARFAADVADGIDEHDYLGPTIERTEHRAGVIKVAGSEALTDRERRAFEAAAIVHAATGVPILTHCTEGIGALEQLRFLAEHGVAPAHVTLSHTDKVVDRGYHREILATGAFVEYDQGFRWKAGVDNGTLTLLAWMIEDGHGDQLMLGMDAARQGYWATYGGSPGWTFLLGPFAEQMRDRGIGTGAQDAIFVDQPGPRLRLRGRLVTDVGAEARRQPHDERRGLARPPVVAGRRRGRCRTR